MLGPSAKAWLYGLGAVAFFVVIASSFDGWLHGNVSNLLFLFYVVLFLVCAGKAAEVGKTNRTRRVSEASERFQSEQSSAKVDSIPKKFLLYLRPFKTEGQTKVGASVDIGPASPSYYTDYGWDEFEGFLARGCGREFDLVAIGGDENVIGPVRIRSPDESWEEKFAALAKNAGVIVILPTASSKGSRWEIEWLHSNNLLDRCLFIMPQRMNAVQQDDWTTMCEIFRQNGIEIPQYKKSGCYFRLDFKGNIVARYSLKQYSKHALSELIRLTALNYNWERPNKYIVFFTAISCGAYVCFLMSLSGLNIGFVPIFTVAANIVTKTRFSVLEVIGMCFMTFCIVLLLAAGEERKIMNFFLRIREYERFANNISDSAYLLAEAAVVGIIVAIVTYRTSALVTIAEALRLPVVWTVVALLLLVAVNIVGSINDPLAVGVIWFISSASAIYFWLASLTKSDTSAVRQ